MTKPRDKDRQPAEPKIKLADLMFYFDSQERDRLDQGRLGRKSGQVLALRERLMKLPTEEFDVTMKSIEALVSVSNAPHALSGGRSSQGMRPKDAIALFEKATEVTADEPTDQSPRVSRV